MRIARLSSGELARLNDGRAGILDYDADLATLLRQGGRPEDLDVVREVDLNGLMLAAPLQPGKIIAIGLNYRDHCREANTDPPDEPLIFAKFPSSVIGPSDVIHVDRTITNSVDWEAELGVVIGRRMRNVPRREALGYVYGYTVVNDVSARDVQVTDQQWVRAKSLDTFCPLGPWVVSADEIPDPQTLRIWTAVNGVTMQDSSTSEMIFGVAELLEYCSKNFTLERGDLLVTGTPWGVGVVRTPPVTLQDGDVVTVGVEGVGEIVNPVADVPHPTLGAPKHHSGRSMSLPPARD